MQKLLIDTAIIHIPGIQSITVSPATSKASRIRANPRCGTSEQRYISADIIKSVESYSPPASCWYLPQVIVAAPDAWYDAVLFWAVMKAHNGNKLTYTMAPK